MIPLVDLYAQHRSLWNEMERKIKEVVEKSAFIQGEYVQQFEKNFAKVIGTKYCVGCSNGTSALSVSLEVLGIGKGDEVITTPLTFFATVEAICHVGAKPVFVDIDAETYNIDCNAIENVINERTKAIIPVHLYGNPVDMEKIIHIARKYNLKIVEDCAQAHLAKFGGKNVGTFGDIATFSFFPGKNLGALGDAGAIVTDKEEYYTMAKKLVDHGRIDKYCHEIVGYNFRLDGLQAAILDLKLKYLDEWIRKRQEKAELYNFLLKNNENVVLPKATKNGEHVYHLYVIQINRRDKVIQELKKSSISSSIHYPIPLHLQPALEFLDYKKGDFPVVENIVEKILTLPLYPELPDKDIEFICSQINKITMEAS